MPLSTSLGPTRPKRRLNPSPRMPHQFARMPQAVVGWAMIAGVHSTVWIFAMSAELTRRALS